MQGDPNDFYSDLGVSPTASIEEIKSVYRALVKIYHPDVNKDRAAVEKFKRITAAYEVLSDERKRAEYDRGTQAEASRQRQPRQQAAREPVEPVHCSKCGKVTAQPRYLAFREIRSFILATQTKIRQGIYCSDCAPKEAWSASMSSAILGWWGFPWGPILTIKEILRNAFGGQRITEVEDQLNWQNALAFFDRERFELALSLARPLQSSKLSELANAARQMTDVLTRNGVKSSSLKSNWRLNAGGAVGQVLMASIVPAIAYILITQPFAPKNYAAAPHRPSPTTASYAPPTPAPAPAPVVSRCASPPANSQILVGKSSLKSGQGHELTIRNGSGGDAIVKVRNSATNNVVVSFYVRQNQSATIDGIPDGYYRIQFGYGEALDASCRAFINTRASEFEGIQALQTEQRVDGIYTSVLSFTLYTVAGGNASIDGISSAAFND